MSVSETGRTCVQVLDTELIEKTIEPEVSVVLKKLDTLGFLLSKRSIMFRRELIIMIKLKNVSKTYMSGEVATRALIDINLEIEDGEILVILGPSGSGKSTLLNVISGLDRISDGSISYNSTVVSDLNERDFTMFRRKNLSFIFQQYNLLQNLNVRDNVEIGAAISESPLDIDELLTEVGLGNMKNKYPYQLSGGEQQRVSVARSLAKNPKIMFCDEPTGALDQDTGQGVLALIERMNELYHTTTVIITHNPNIAKMAHRVVRMNSGKIREIRVNQDRCRASDITWA